MRSLRKALAPGERSSAAQSICGILARDLSVTAATTGNGGALAVYLASADEIDLTSFISLALERGIVVAAPRWNGHTYELARLHSLNVSDLRTGPMNILEPALAEIIDPGDVGAWIIPGLAFTPDGKRLGYGGGWYDRFLAAAKPGSLKIGVCHGFQLVETIPVEAHDIRLDRTITGTGDSPRV